MSWKDVKVNEINLMLLWSPFDQEKTLFHPSGTILFFFPFISRCGLTGNFKSICHGEELPYRSWRKTLLPLLSPLPKSVHQVRDPDNKENSPHRHWHTVLLSTLPSHGSAWHFTGPGLSLLGWGQSRDCAFYINHREAERWSQFQDKRDLPVSLFKKHVAVH